MRWNFERDHPERAKQFVTRDFQASGLRQLSHYTDVDMWPWTFVAH